MIVGTEVSFIGHVTAFVRQEHHSSEMDNRRLVEMGAAVAERFPSIDSYNIATSDSVASITFNIHGDADNEDEVKLNMARFGKMIYSKNTDLFSSYTTSAEITPLVAVAAPS